jgi:hypothetical protein
MYHYHAQAMAHKADQWTIYHGGDTFAFLSCTEENVAKMVDSLNLASAPCYVCQSKEHGATECTA